MTHLTILIACGDLLVHGFFLSAAAAVGIPIVLSIFFWRFFEARILRRRPKMNESPEVARPAI
jgi:peptidoglycan/LPS O-acetylase OafA/YrhL